MDNDSQRPVYVLGLSYSHDASACLLRDGRPAVAIQKERITRRKHDGGSYDTDLAECIEYCLSAEGIDIDDVALAIETVRPFFTAATAGRCSKWNTPRLLDALPESRIKQVSHHLAHAYLAYGISPFDKCACMVLMARATT